MIRPAASKRRTRPQGSSSLLLGYGTPPQPTLGFSTSSSPSPATAEPIVHAGDGHLLTVAPTRAGKGTGVVIPNLLRYRGSAVVTDPKGEIHRVTAQQRRRMGQTVIKLAPFAPTSEPVDSLNPFDMLQLLGANLEIDSQTLASMLARGSQGFKEPFWDLSGTGLNAGIIAYVGNQEDPGRRNLTTLLDILFSDDVTYNLAVLLDTQGKTMPTFAHRELAAFLGMADVTRSGVLATAQSYLKPFLSPTLTRSFERSSFDLKEFVDGAPMTIYITIPPTRLHSHRALLKLWMGTLMAGVLSRTRRPRYNTLFMLDEVMQLENFPLLESLVTLAGGYGAWAWLICQDLAQLATWYPKSWKTLLNNCSVLQTFGINNRAMGTQWSEYLDHGPTELRALSAEQQVVSIQGHGEYICRRPNYLTDSEFKGQFVENPYYAGNSNSQTTRSL